MLFNPKQFQAYQYKLIITILNPISHNSITYFYPQFHNHKYNKISSTYHHNSQSNISQLNQIFLSTNFIIINTTKYHHHPFIITILNPIYYNSVTYIFIIKFHNHKYNQILSKCKSKFLGFLSE